MRRDCLASVLLVGFCISAQAETGPCKPDRFHGLTCGEGAGAARVVDGTTSPSKRLAFAWRSPGHTTDAPDSDAVESLLIRLADGAVLAHAAGDYWNTGTRIVNRYQESASWSPDSRYVVETENFRSQTIYIQLYFIGADDKVAALDVKSIVEPAARKYLRRIGKDERDYAFQIYGGTNDDKPQITIDNGGVIKALVMMNIARPEFSAVMLDVTFKAAESHGTLSAREVSIRRSKIEPYAH